MRPRLSFTTKLTVFVFVAVTLPVVVMGVVALGIVRSQSGERLDEILDDAEAAVATELAGRRSQLISAARAVEAEATLSEDDADRILAENPGVDTLIVVDSDGRLRFARTSEVGVSPAFDSLRIIDGSAAGTIVAEIPLDDSRVIAASLLDDDFARRVAARSNAQLTVVQGDTVLGSSLSPEESTELLIRADESDGRIRDAIDGDDVEVQFGEPISDAGDVRPVIAVGLAPFTQVSSTAVRAFVLLIIGSVGLALAMRVVLRRYIMRPLNEVSDAARAIAKGDWEEGELVPVRSDDEIGRLASTYNEMSTRLRDYLREIERSRSELATALVRFGAMLEGTHDRDAILRTAAEISRRDLRAATAGLFLIDSPRDFLEIFHVDGATGELSVGDRLRSGQGLAGRIAKTGEPARVWKRGDRRRTETITTAAPEPDAAAIAVPVHTEGRLYAVLALYGRTGPGSFDDADLQLLEEFGRQTGVAIDNVVNHEAAHLMSIKDPLTGIWNRRYFDLIFSGEIERSNRFGHPMSLLFVDIDDFKRINDSQGHQAGDEVLVQVGRVLVGETRQIDTVCRYGGEEFTICLPETPPDGAVYVAEKIVQTFSEHRFRLGSDVVRLTVSVGIAACPHHGRAPEQIVRGADKALYEAKRRGKNRVHVADLDVREARSEAERERRRER